MTNLIVIKEYNPVNWVHYILLDDKALLSQCRLEMIRGSGKGGQKKNKTSNAIRLHFFHFKAFSQKQRSQTANIKIALKKLRLEIALNNAQKLGSSNLFPRKNWETIPPALRPFLANGRMLISVNNKNYPYFLGFLKDLVWQLEGDEKKMATFLGISRSQLQKWDKKNANLLTPFRLKIKPISSV